jgi:hypothetical protein
MVLERFDIENVEPLCKDLPCKSLLQPLLRGSLRMKTAIGYTEREAENRCRYP